MAEAGDAKPQPTRKETLETGGNAMSIYSFRLCGMLTAFVLGLLPICAATVVIETVTVGNQGNAGEGSGGAGGTYGPYRVCGAVDYTYGIGKYEVTTSQYTVFLNAVAATDTYGLFNSSSGITQNGVLGSYTYSVPDGYDNLPINYVSWGDAARFANWLHNGQPTGSQGPSTTETGAYALSGATSRSALLTITREPDARWAIPTEDEWYKAAYHLNDGVTGNYYDYPTGSNTVPTLEPPPGGSNSANCDHTLGAPDYRNDVGAYALSSSPYGTFDQGGNVWEWNEAVVNPECRGIRGSSYEYPDYGMGASFRAYEYPEYEYGFVRLSCRISS